MGISWGNSVKRFAKNVTRTAEETEKEIHKIVHDTGVKLKRDVKSLTPVRSGVLRSQWFRKGSGKGSKRKVVVSNDISYAKAVEYGSKKRPPARMLSKAVKMGNKFMKKRLRQIGKRMKRNFG